MTQVEVIFQNDDKERVSNQFSTDVGVELEEKIQQLSEALQSKTGFENCREEFHTQTEKGDQYLVESHVNLVGCEYTVSFTWESEKSVFRFESIREADRQESKEHGGFGTDFGMNFGMTS